MNIILIIQIISVIGILFSGYMTIKEISKKLCPINAKHITCNETIFGLPSCFYGLLMYLIIFVLTFFI